MLSQRKIDWLAEKLIDWPDKLLFIDYLHPSRESIYEIFRTLWVKSGKEKPFWAHGEFFTETDGGFIEVPGNGMHI